LGYLLLPSIPDEIDESLLLKTLYKSAASLGIDRATCMVDFIINQGRIILIELSPRPGGDCLPYLLRRCRNLDILSFTLDFSRQKPVFINKQTDSTCFMGMRLLASRGGILKKLDVSKLIEAPMVREIHLIRQPGHQIVMPPDDYDSWLLGHIIIKTDQDIDIHEQCVRVLDKINMEIE
jgi:hypothetical protein